MRLRFTFVLLAIGCSSGVAQAHEDLSPSTTKTVSVDAEGDDLSKRAAKWKGSLFFFDQSITPDTLNEGSQLSPMPSYQWWLSLRPRYYITPKLSIRARADLTVEWTNAADTTHFREAQWGDLWLDVAYSLPKFWGIEPTVGFRSIWGTSLESMQQHSIVRLGPTVGFSRPFEHTKIGDFELALGVYGVGNLSTNTSSSAVSSYGCVSSDFTPTFCNQDTGAMNPRFTLVASVFGKYRPIKSLAFAVSYTVIDTWVYPTPDITLTDMSGGTTTVPHSPNDQRFRQTGWFLASVNYDVNKWFTLSLGYYCWRPMLDLNGTYGNPFYMPGGVSRIFLTLEFGLDYLYDAVAKKVRAHRASKAAALNAAPLPRNGALSFASF